MDHLKGLNDAQRAAVEATDGPVMVIAGAGSGKTKALTVRIAHLMTKGVDPFRILALTFTNKAAKEMKERIAKLLAGMPGMEHEVRNLWMGTFHSVFARILRAEADKLGYPKDFTIYDTDDSRSLIRTIVKELQLDEKLYKASQVHGRISIAKNNLMGPKEYLANAELMASDAANMRPHIGTIYQQYAARCYRAGAMDFDDLLFLTNILFRDHPDVMLKYQQRFQYLLVDEYQDTNLAQYNIVRTLAARHQNVTVVGDDSQSIYAFRGANIQNILNFKTDYPDHRTFKLEQNYRSTKNIVGAANSLIEKNRERLDKTVWTANEEGAPITVNRSISDNDEGRFVADDIFATKMHGQLHNRDFAILYRTNAQSRSMEEALRKANIPYRIHGGLSFYQRKEVKDLIAYFRLTCNPNDEEALKRVINYPARGIGQSTVDKLMVTANQHETSMWVAMNQHLHEAGLHEGLKKKIAEFVMMVRSFQTMLDNQSAYTLGEYIARTTGLMQDLFQDKTPEGVSRYENIQALLNGIREFSDPQGNAATTEPGTDPETTADGEQVLRTLPDFLIDVALLTDADNEDPNDSDRVTLMTIHSAKGLEFPYVYIVGMEENLFPNMMNMTSRAELEEERRLFYVAITRAEKRATLSYATSRYKWGQLQSSEPSRFLQEIDKRYLVMPGRQELAAPVPRRSFAERNGFTTRPAATPGPRAALKERERPANTTAPAPGKRNLKRISPSGRPMEATSASDVSPAGDIVEGATVEHERFGKGKVVKMEGAPPDQKATIFFPSAGQKQLLLRFAKLKVLEAGA
ncbi:MAG TPA: UvrD-helicase domain-containing protein [Flavobacteriales bacterium]|nr:UvrD-helicase domain-containing protein [Flavobacteriales bacterium]